MALMPEDLQNKRFTPVRFSEGYDMDEVDNYLDNDVMPRLQELIDENARLRSELEEAHNRVAALESRPAAPEASEQTPEIASAPAFERPADDDTVVTPAASAPAASTGDGADQSAAGIIALAHRLHDEHVRNGENERDRLISEADSESRRIVGEAEEKSRTTLDALETQKAALEKSIDGLRTFERDYRNRLRNYLENQPRDLDTSDTQDKQANFGL